MTFPNNILVLDPGVKVERATKRSACFDLYNQNAGDTPLKPHESMSFRVGIMWREEVIKNGGGPGTYVAYIYSRSGLSLRGIIVANAPGVIDEDYPGEWKVILHNLTDSVVPIKFGDKIAQCQITMVPAHTLLVPAADVTRSGGFGSTGI